MRSYIFFTFIIIISLINTISSAPEDLTCNGVTRRTKYELKNCKIINGKINCQSYITITPTVNLHLNSTYYINDEETPVPGYQGCLGVEDIKIEKINKLPEDAVNIHSISTINPIPTTIVRFKDLSVHFTLKSSAIIGLLQIKPTCNTTDQLNRDSSCISKIEVSSFVLAPADTDFNVADLLLGRVSELFFERMNATVEKIALKLNGETPDVASYLSMLEKGNLKSIEITDTNVNRGFILTNLPSLTQLTCKNCSLKTIDERNFELGMENLEILDISDNLLTSPPYGINNLKKLRSLNLSGQKVSNFTLGDKLNSMNQLKDINLSNMPVYGIKRSSFPNSTSLESIDLSLCQLKSIDEDLFYNIEDLKELKLSGNQLSQIKPKTFERMPPDSKISLDNNKISREPKFYVQPNVEITGVTFERLQVKNDDPNNSVKNVGFICNLILSYFVLYFLVY